MAVRLTYLPLAARGFPIRFALRVAGIDFIDDRMPREQLHSLRSAAGYSADFPLGQLPVLKIGDELFTESVALSRWAARKSTLMPTDELDALRVEEIVAVVDELWSKVSAHVLNHLHCTVRPRSLSLPVTVPLLSPLLHTSPLAGAHGTQHPRPRAAPRSACAFPDRCRAALYRAHPRADLAQRRAVCVRRGADARRRLDCCICGAAEHRRVL